MFISPSFNTIEVVLRKKCILIFSKHHLIMGIVNYTSYPSNISDRWNHTAIANQMPPNRLKTVLKHSMNLFKVHPFKGIWSLK